MSTDLERIDPDELARTASASRTRGQAKQVERMALDRAWREQQEYARAVAELKQETAARKPWLGPAIAAAILVATGALGGALYMQDRKAEAEAVRIAVEARARREQAALQKLTAEAPAREAPAPQEEKAASEPAAGPATGPAAKARVDEDAKRAAVEKARALALKTQAAAMVQAEDRAKAVSAVSVQEAPRAVPRPGTVFQDCPDCPRMVVIPAGEFAMGSPASEAGRGVEEGPQRQVSIAQAFALGRGEVTVAEFRRFAEEAGYKTEAERDARAQGCSGFIYAEAQSVTSWRNPGLVQTDSHPVLCVSWNDARAYAQWLSKKTGKRYRLPTEAEWEFAARAGSPGARYWGDDPVLACRYANVADQSRQQTWGFGQKHECTDGHYFTAPAGGYAPNRFGLYDMLGNAWEWTEDCWNPGYAGAPSDGSAWLAGDCAQRVSRGGSWSTVPRFARAATRHKNTADHRDNLTGFRLARTLE